MIKNPKDFLWTMPNCLDSKSRKWSCPHNVRYSLPCGRVRLDCSKCLIKQMNADDKYNLSHPEDYVVHVCDRCGKEIPYIDNIVYLDISNRAGVTLLTQELCFQCGCDLVEWAEKKDSED